VGHSAIGRTGGVCLRNGSGGFVRPGEEVKAGRLLASRGGELARAAENVLQFGRCIGVDLVKHVAVCIVKERHARVPQPIGGGFRLDTGQQHCRRIAVSRVVEADVTRQVCTIKRLLKAGAGVADEQRCASLAAEH
jgi:hypothetical protein